MEVNGNKVGIAAELTTNPSIVCSGAPTSETPASVGQLYMDADTGDLYKCTAFTDGAYVWEPVGGEGNSSGAGSYIVKVNRTYDEEAGEDVYTTEGFNWDELKTAVEAGKNVFCRIYDVVAKEEDGYTMAKDFQLNDFSQEEHIAQFQQVYERNTKCLYVYEDGSVHYYVPESHNLCVKSVNGVYPVNGNVPVLTPLMVRMRWGNSRGPNFIDGVNGMICDCHSSAMKSAAQYGRIVIGVSVGHDEDFGDDTIVHHIYRYDGDHYLGNYMMQKCDMTDDNVNAEIWTYV